ncbi:MAG: aldose 1-epimerase [Acidimicrobiales bacterium]
MIELHAGPARVLVDPAHGGRLASVSVAGLELLVDRTAAGGDPLGWGCYPMAPWAGRVRHGRFAFDGVGYRLALNLAPHAIHGTVLDAQWDVEATGTSHCRMACDLGPRWPFRGRVTQEVSVDPGGLHLSLQVWSDGGPMPASAGWHPWFVRDVVGGGALEVSLDAERRWERDTEGIPTGIEVPAGSRPPFGWDDCFAGLVADPVLTWPGALELTLRSTCSDWVLFDAPSHAVCVEPQTGPPDALNLGPSVVTPGRPLTASFAWAWRLG